MAVAGALGLLGWFVLGVLALRVLSSAHIDVDDSATRELTIAYGALSLVVACLIAARRRRGQREWEGHRR